MPSRTASSSGSPVDESITPEFRAWPTCAHAALSSVIDSGNVASESLMISSSMTPLNGALKLCVSPCGVSFVVYAIEEIFKFRSKTI